MASKVRTKFVLWGLLLGIVTTAYIIFGLNTVSIVNQSNYKLEHVKIYRAYNTDNIIWEGDIKPHGKKHQIIAAGTSDSKLVVEVMCQGKLISKKQWYPAFGPGKFHFQISNNCHIHSDATNIFD